MTTFAPTSEQQEALQLFATGENLVIEAGAGTGKTSTLLLLANSTTRRGQYLAFNRAIVDESKQKFPATVRCNTAHSAAYRAMASRMNMERLRTSRMKSWDIAARLGITGGIQITTQEGERKSLSPTYLAGLTMKAITKFCQSADELPTEFHVPYIKGIDFPPGDYTNNRIVARELVTFMRIAWADLMSKNGSLKFEHDHYLKAWQLDNPRIATDYILFDEAQDANPVMVDIVAKQDGHAQLVFVGDSQQQIYSFTGAVNAMQTVATGENTTYLTQSFRFGDAVAQIANSVLAEIEDAKLRLVGTPSIPSTVGGVSDPDAILTRTNAEAVRNVLQAQQDGKRPHLVGGGNDIVAFAKAAKALQDGLSTDHPELACFSTWGEVLDYVEHDEQGADLQLLVKLITEFTVETILAALDNMVDEHVADVVVSTAHKSKGREWNSVTLGADFPDEMKNDEELRLLYVAVTRAKLALDISNVGWFADGFLPADLIEGPVESCDDDDHDFASCPSCIREAREAEHEAETVLDTATPSEVDPPVSASPLGSVESARAVHDTGDGYGKPENVKASTVKTGDMIFRLYGWREVTMVADNDGETTIHYYVDGSPEWTRVSDRRSLRIRRKTTQEAHA